MIYKRFQDFLFRDNTHYHSPISVQDSPVDKYSYLGMAVAAGNFLPPSRYVGIILPTLDYKYTERS